jgi:hypothetical protein
MSAKCTKELIVESITNAINTQPQTETAKVFKSTVNNFVGYIAELGINNSQDLNVHIPKADVFAPYLHKIGEVLNEGNKLFLVKNRDTKSSTFLEPSTYKNSDELVSIFMEAGLTPELSTQLVKLFKAFTTKVNQELKSSNTVYENDVLPLLYGANKIEGRDTTYHLPAPVLFSASTSLLRWFATDGARTLNTFTDTQIQLIVGAERTSDILDETLTAFRNLDHGGMLRGEAARSLGSLIFDSLNIKSNLATSSTILDDILAHQLGALALEIGVKMGLIKSAEVVYKVNQNGKLVTKKFAHYYITQKTIDVNNIDIKKITDHSKHLDSFFGVNQSFNAPSATPLPNVSKNVRGSLGSVSPQAHQVINKLVNTEWTVNSAYHLYMIGSDTANAPLQAKAVKLRKVLAGVTFLNPSDALNVHVDLEEGIKAKDRQLLDQIKVIKKYSDNNLINSFYLQWKFMAQHRMMIEGELDPMSAKNVARFLLKPAKSKSIIVDPATKDSKAVISFKVAVAQHFDLSVDKTDVQGSLELFDSVFSDMENEQSALSRAVQSVIQLSIKPNEVTEENYLDAMLELHTKYPGANTALIMAVNALAQYQSALEEDTTFTTDIIAEADAVTSGFGIGLMLFPSNNMDDMMRELNRVGMIFEGQVPYSEQVKNANGATPDGYLNFANALFDKFENLPSYLDTNGEHVDPKVAESRFKAFNTIFAPLVTNRRNAGKPPFMVLNYEGGAAKVAKELSVSLVDSLFEYITEAQGRYTNGSPEVKAEIYKELATMFKSMRVLTKSKAGKEYLPGGLTSGVLKTLLATNELHRYSFNEPLYRGSPIKYRDYLISKLGQALTPAIKVAAAETIVNSEIKSDFIKAGELQYFIFKVKYNNLVKEVAGRSEGKLFPSQRKELARELIDFYPRIALKHQDGTESFIDLVKSTQIQHSTKFELKLNSGNVSTRMLTYSFAPPGVSTVVRSIQGTDAVKLQDSISIPNVENTEIPLLPLHDAVMEVIGQLPTTKGVYNSGFKSLASDTGFDLFTQVNELLTSSWNMLTPAEQHAVREAYLKHSYLNRNEDSEVSFDSVMGTVQRTAKEVQQNRGELAKMLETATSEHMYIASPESTENVDFSAEAEALKQSLEENSKDYQRSSQYKLLKDNRELFRVLTNRLTEMFPNITLEERDTLVDIHGEQVLGNAIGTAIQYSNSKGALDTVPHEYAHVYLNLLEHTTIISKQISTIQAVHNVNRKEAKEILANEMGRIFTDKVLEGKGKKTQSIVRRVWEFIKEVFKPLYLSTEKMRAEYIYRELAWKLINGISGESLTTTPKKGYTLQKFDTILKNNKWGAEVIDTVISKMLPEALLVGSLALTAAGNVYRKGVGSLHDIDFAMPLTSFKPGRGLKGNIKTYFPGAQLLYEYDNATDIDKATEKVLTYVVPPTGTQIANVQRFDESEFGRVIAWDVVDSKNPSKILGTYRAEATKDLSAPEWSVRSKLVSETSTGVEAVLVDFLTDIGVAPATSVYSTYLGKMVKVASPKSVFTAKNSITKEDIPRDKDVMDFNLFAPDKDGVTPPDLFGEVIKGSSFAELLESSTTWHNNAPLSSSALVIFDGLGKQDLHYDSAHAEHLQNILHTLVLEHMANVEDVVVQTAFIKGKTRGGFSEDLRKVIVQLNKNAPITYAEQSPQEVFVHEILHAVIDHVLAANPRLQVELSKLHREAIKHISVDDFLIDGIKSDEVAERAIATQQYEYVYRDSTEFLIYTLTNKGLLAKMQTTAPPRSTKLWEGAEFSDKIINLIQHMINAFNTKVRHKKLTTSQYQDFFNLGLKIATINSKHEKSLTVLAKKFHIEALVEQGMDKVADVMVKSTVRTGQFLFKNTEIGKTIGHIKELPDSIRKVATESAFLKAFAALNDIEQVESLSLLVKDLIVGTGSMDIMDLVLKAKGLIDSTRIHRAKSLVKKLRAHTKSKKAIDGSEQTAVTKVFIKTDIQSLLKSGRFDIAEIIKLIKYPQLLHNKIAEYETRVGTSTNNFYSQQVEGLASFMVRTSSVSALQGLNASRIYQLHQQLYGEEVLKDAGIIQELDILISLTALQNVPESTKTKALRVAEEEMSLDNKSNLITTLIEQHKVLVGENLEHNFNNSPYAMIKGYTRNSYNSNIEIVSAPLDDKKQMHKDGYVFSHELPYIPGVNKTRFGLFVNPYNPEAGRTTGVIPYSGQKSKGTTLFEILSNDEAYQKQDPTTGNMVGDIKLIRPVIDRYIDKQIELLTAQVTSGKMGSNTQLIPLINEAGEIYDFRVMMSTSMQESLLDPDMTYENVMSQLSIHYIDRKMTGEIEKSSMEYLVQVMNTEYKGSRDKSFINILDGKYREKYFLPLSATFKARVKANSIKTDAGDVFPIKKEELHILFGAKDMSVRDLPYYDSYPAPLKRSLLRVNATTLAVIRIAVTNIILKMPEVITDNIVSNTIILLLNGVNPVKAVQGQLQVVKDLREWKNTSAEMIDLYYTYHGSDIKNRNLLLRIEALGNSLKKSPIFELMDMQLFTSMVEEINLKESSAADRWANSVEAKLGKYGAAPVMGAAKLLYMTKSTALYQGMQEAFQMSDFLARVVLNDHLKKTGMSDNERKRTIYETFVLYDVPGTSRLATFINKTGFTFFWSYFIKLQRAIFRTTKRRTKSVLFLLGMQEATNVDVPDIFDSAIVTGNFAPPLSNPVEALEHVIKLPGVEFIDDLL